jgi:hypothetical protein
MRQGREIAGKKKIKARGRLNKASRPTDLRCKAGKR